MNTILFTNAHLNHEPGLCDLLVEDGRFLEIGPCLNKKYPIGNVCDLNGKLVLPPFVDSHIHLDYVYTAREPGADNCSGTLFEGIERWSHGKRNRSVEEIKRRARTALKKEILNGTQYMRTHVDVTDPSLTGLKAILELRDELKGVLDLQVIAFPQEGMYSYTNGHKLVEEALIMGADVVGAIPHYEFTREWGEKSIQTVVQLALKYDKLIDIHCDETDDEQSRFIESLAALAYQNGNGSRTTASHACAMGSYNNAYVYKLFQLLERSGINIISCPTENIHLQGRYDSYPKRRGLTRVKELSGAGINVCFAQDSISDPWYPLGNGNLMTILDFGLHICHLMSFPEIENSFCYITDNGARTLSMEGSYGIRPGNDADFIVLDAPDAFEAIRERVGVLASVRRGNFLFRKQPAKTTFNCGFLSRAEES